jgi:hypothetical protein
MTTFGNQAMVDAAALVGIQQLMDEMDRAQLYKQPAIHTQGGITGAYTPAQISSIVDEYIEQLWLKEMHR